MINNLKKENRRQIIKPYAREVLKEISFHRKIIKYPMLLTLVSLIIASQSEFNSLSAKISGSIFILSGTASALISLLLLLGIGCYKEKPKDYKYL